MRPAAHISKWLKSIPLVRLQERSRKIRSNAARHGLKGSEAKAARKQKTASTYHTSGEDEEDATIGFVWDVWQKEICVTRGRSRVFMELMHTRSQLRRSTMRQANDILGAWEGQNRQYLQIILLVSLMEKAVSM